MLASKGTNQHNGHAEGNKKLRHIYASTVGALVICTTVYDLALNFQLDPFSKAMDCGVAKSLVEQPI